MQRRQPVLAREFRRELSGRHDCFLICSRLCDYDLWRPGGLRPFQQAPVFHDKVHRRSGHLNILILLAGRRACSPKTRSPPLAPDLFFLRQPHAILGVHGLEHLLSREVQRYFSGIGLGGLRSQRSRCTLPHEGGGRQQIAGTGQQNSARSERARASDRP